MTKPSWFGILGRAAMMVPAVREALGKTLNGLERDPATLKLVQSFQSVDQKDCLICLAYGLGKLKPPEHWCPTRENQDLCGCGKPAMKDTPQFTSPRRVCAEFPGCLPKSKSTSTERG
jgi:hypothetical protein